MDKKDRSSYSHTSVELTGSGALTPKLPLQHFKCNWQNLMWVVKILVFGRLLSWPLFINIELIGLLMFSPTIIAHLHNHFQVYSTWTASNKFNLGASISVHPLQSGPLPTLSSKVYHFFIFSFFFFFKGNFTYFF